MDVASLNLLSVLCVYSGCDVNSPRRPGANGEGDEEARDGQTPLHLASTWGLEEAVQCLLEFGANVNAQVSPVTSVGPFLSDTTFSCHCSIQTMRDYKSVVNISKRLILCLSIPVRMQKAELPSMLPLAASTTSLYSSSFPIQTFASTFATVKE